MTKKTQRWKKLRALEQNANLTELWGGYQMGGEEREHQNDHGDDVHI